MEQCICPLDPTVAKERLKESVRLVQVFGRGQPPFPSLWDPVLVAARKSWQAVEGAG